MSENPIAKLPSASVAEGRYLEVAADGLLMLLCRVRGQVFAIENKCSHQKLPLAGGRLIGCRLVCPHHSAAFDVTTGKALSFPAVAPLKTFAVDERDGVICVGPTTT